MSPIPDIPDRAAMLLQGVGELGQAASLRDAVAAANWAVVVSSADHQPATDEERDYLTLLRTVLTEDPRCCSLRTLKADARRVLIRHGRLPTERSNELG